MATISVSLSDGSRRELTEGSSGADLAAAIGPGLAADALVAVVDGEERDLDRPLPDGARVEIVTAASPVGLYTIRHSTAHVLAQAVLDLYPGATYGIGPPIEDGFYYDFELADHATFDDGDLERIEARMREIIARDQPFVRVEVGATEALELFCGHPYKQEIIAAVALGGSGSTTDAEADDDAGSFRGGAVTSMDSGELGRRGGR